MCTKVPKTGAVVLMGFITALIYFVTLGKVNMRELLARKPG